MIKVKILGEAENKGWMLFFKKLRSFSEILKDLKRGCSQIYVEAYFLCL